MKIKPFVSFVVLLRNPGESIADWLSELDHYLAQTFESYEVILVDNASTDGTPERIKQMRELDLEHYTLVTLAWKHGIDLAALSGVELAIGDFVYEIEQHIMDFDLALLEQLFQESAAGIDVVAASPNTKPKWSSRLFYRLLNKIAYVKLDLTTEHVRLVSRRVLNAVLKIKERIRYRKVLYRYAGFPHKTLTYTPRRSDKGRGETDSAGEKINLALDVFVSFSDIGLRLSMGLSFVFLVISLALGGYSLFFYFLRQGTISGWTTVMLFLSFGFSGMFLIFILFSKYLSILLTEMLGRPQYTYRSIERLANTPNPCLAGEAGSSHLSS